MPESSSSPHPQPPTATASTAAATAAAAAAGYDGIANGTSTAAVVEGPLTTAAASSSSQQQPMLMPPTAVPPAAPAPGVATTASATDKAPNKKKQIGNWLFKKLGGSVARHHHHAHSLDGNALPAHHGLPELTPAAEYAAVNGAGAASTTANGTLSSSRSRRPSFPRSRRGTASNTQAQAEAPSAASSYPNGTANLSAAAAAGAAAINGNSTSTPSQPSPRLATRRLGSTGSRPASADAKGGPPSGGIGSFFWRASHIDGVPTPFLSKGKAAAYLDAIATNSAGVPNGSNPSVLRPQLSASKVADGLADTLVVPTTPTLERSNDLSPPPRLPDPRTSPSLDQAAILGNGNLRRGEQEDDEDASSIGRRTGASSPAPSHTAYSIGTTSLGTDTSAAASSINSLVRIRNGADLRMGLHNIAAMDRNLGASPSMIPTNASLVGADIPDIPDGSTTDHHSDSQSSLDSERAWRRRYSGDNATMDTGKSVSTKPTTVMSLDTRDGPAGAATMAHIAQYRHGDPTSPNFSSHQVASSSAAATGGPSTSLSRNSNFPTSGSASIHFADLTPAARVIRATSMGTSASGTSQLPGQGQPIEDAGPFVNVPSFSRPHPSNNPAPQAIPADNASMLTLASSTAAQSILGGTGPLSGGGVAPSIRTHGRAPSVATRSLGGSLMGDRRNSSDTYASLKALPPLSRRGSDASTTTGLESIAPSVHGVASIGTGGLGTEGRLGSVLGAPGAPSDRVGLQRSSSTRTVNTQLSVPLSLPPASQGTYAHTPQGHAPSSIAGVALSAEHAKPTSIVSGRSSSGGASSPVAMLSPHPADGTVEGPSVAAVTSPPIDNGAVGGSTGGGIVP